MTETFQQESQNWHIPFFTIWGGQALSLVGSSLAQFALIWWVTATTDSATVLATATLVSILPTIFFGPIAGALVDRWNRRVVLIVADTCIALVSAWLAYLFWSDGLRVWHVYVIMFLRSVGGNFHTPTMVASTAMMVPKKHLARINGLNQALNGGKDILTPPLSALLMSVLPLHYIMGIDVLTACFAVIPLFFIRIPQPRYTPSDQTENPRPGWRGVLNDVKIGLRYVWQWKGLRTLYIISSLLTVAIRPSFALIPILVKHQFQGQAIDLAGFESALGLGILTGGIILGIWGGFRRQVVTILMGIIGMGIGLCMVSFIPPDLIWLGPVAMFIAGFMFPVIDGPLVALIQSTVDTDMQGRMFSLMVSLSEALSPISMLIAGPIADVLGVRTWYVLGGTACLVLGIAGLFMPWMTKMEENSLK